MTDHPDDGPTDDVPEADLAFELASALHDGEGDDIDRVAADEAVQAGARRVAALAQDVGDVPPAPPGLLEDHVAAAMAAFDEARPAVAGTRVTSLADRRRSWPRVPLGAVAAVVAVVAVVALVGVVGLGAGGGDDDDTTANATFDVAGEAGDDSGDSSGPGDRGEEAAEGAAPGDGSFDADSGDEGPAPGASAITGDERRAYGSYAELAAALRVEVSERTTTGSQPVPEESTAGAESESSVPPDAESDLGGGAGCDAVSAAGVDPATVEVVVPVVVEGRLVTAVVHADDDGRRLASVEESTCRVADERAL